MNSKRRDKNTGYLVALLLVIGLTAVSNSMRELAEIHQFTLGSGRLIAQYFVPGEIPQTVAKLESCDRTQAAPFAARPWLEDVQGITEPSAQLTIRTPQTALEKVERRVRVRPSEVQIAKVNKLRQFDFDPTQFEFRVSTDDNADSDAAIPAQLSLTMFKAKNRKHNIIRFNTRDREMLLKTLNRSINLRTAS